MDRRLALAAGSTRELAGAADVDDARVLRDVPEVLLYAMDSAEAGRLVPVPGQAGLSGLWRRVLGLRELRTLPGEHRWREGLPLPEVPAGCWLRETGVGSRLNAVFTRRSRRLIFALSGEANLSSLCLTYALTL